MKRIVAIMCAFLMMLSLASTAFAADSTPELCETESVEVKFDFSFGRSAAADGTVEPKAQNTITIKEYFTTVTITNYSSSELTVKIGLQSWKIPHNYYRTISYTWAAWRTIKLSCANTISYSMSTT